jgi:hypothetical protein
MATLRRIDFHVEPDISVRQFLDRTASTTACGTYLWAPLCVSGLNTPLEQASTNAFLARCATRSAAAARRAISCCRASTFRACFPSPRRVHPQPWRRVSCGTTIRQPGRAQVPIRKNHRRGRAPPIENAAARGGREFTYQPIYTCYLQYPEGTRLPFPMLGMSGRSWCSGCSTAALCSVRAAASRA